jgi:hypothetical protein
MRKILIVTGLIAILSSVSLAQTGIDTIQKLQLRILNLESLNSRLSTQVNAANSNIKKIEVRLLSTADSMAVLKKEMDLANNNLQAMAINFELQIRQLTDKSNSDILTLTKKMSNNNLYWIIASVVIALIASILYNWLRGRLTAVKTELSDQIRNSSEAIREEIIKLDNQVFWSLDFQKKLSSEEHNESENIDHSLILKVADEIIRIQKNMSIMNPETKGLKQLEFAVDRIQDNFREYGYEIVELLNKPYDQGMKVSAKFRPDDTLKRGEQIITRIIKPQVNYNDLIIQEAQVEVSVGEE